MSNDLSPESGPKKQDEPTSAWPLFLGVFGVPIALIVLVAIIKWLLGF
jgi:hypothetical protein